MINALYRKALDELSMIVVTDDKGIIGEVNESFCRITQYPVAELIGQPLSLIQAAYHPEQFFADLSATITTGQVWRGELKSRAKDGTYFWLDTSIYPLKDTVNQRMGFFCSCLDITAKKAAEAKMRRVNERFRLAAKATNDAIYDWNIEQNEIQWYEAFYDMFGYQTHEVESSFNWWAKRIHPEEAETTVNSLNQTILTKQTHWSTEYRFRCCNGTYKFVCVRGYIVYSEAGAPLRMIGALQDIQQTKEHEHKITQQNEKLREIAFSQSHEVRRPVANILGLLQCLNKEEFGPENRKVLYFLEQTAGELDVLIRKIVDKAYHT